jgi:hypothetical protein
MKNIAFALACLLLLGTAALGQVSEGFDDTIFPPVGWTTSASSGEAVWARIVSNTRDGSPGAASSNNPASGISRYLTVSMNVSASATNVSYYVSVSSLGSAGATLIVQAGIDTTSLTTLRTINLEDVGVFAANTYVQFTDNIDGTLALGQTGTLDLRSANPGYIRWSHQKTSGTAAACRLETVSILNATALPVELLSFTASANRLAATLAWTTETEHDNAGWEIERKSVSNSEFSINNWQAIAFVAGAGNSNSQKEYSYFDAHLVPGRYAYRLKQLDHSGSFTYSFAAEIEVGVEQKVFTLNEGYPNPFNPSTSISFTLGTNGRASLQVFNLLGQHVATLFEGNADAGLLYERIFEAKSLPSGVYFSRLEYLPAGGQPGNGQCAVKKLVLVK